MPELFSSMDAAHSTRVLPTLDQRRAFSGHQVFGCHPDRPHLVGTAVIYSHEVPGLQ